MYTLKIAKRIDYRPSIKGQLKLAQVLSKKRITNPRYSLNQLVDELVIKSK